MSREPTEMELRVAKAIWDCREVGFPKFTRQTWDQGTLLAREATLHLACAAIRVMREPTKEMCVAGIDEGCSQIDYDEVSGQTNCSLRSDAPGMIWQAMIDAASPPEEQGAA